MGEFIKLIAEIVNMFHDLLNNLVKSLGWQFTDKELHFWIMGIIGIFIFAIVQVTFIWISKWSITTISFFYTSTIMVVIVFAIEIQQKITRRGNMEFADAVVGLYGFLALFGMYLLIRFISNISVKVYKRYKNKSQDKCKHFRQ